MKPVKTVRSPLLDGPPGTPKSALFKRTRWQRFKAWVVGWCDGTTLFSLPMVDTTDPADIFGPMVPPYDPRPVAKRNLEDVRKRFAGDIEDHVMEVHHEEGLYRHIRFRKPGTMMYHFDLITWPGYLSIQGDMGGYTFRRLEDMFQFFRSGKDINPQYWGEKLQNGGESGTRGVKRYNPELVEEHMRWAYDDWVAENEVTAKDVEIGMSDESELEAWIQQAEQVWTDIQNDVLLFDQVEHEAREAIGRYEHADDNPVRIYDTWEWDLTDYDYHFLWCLFAIQWGVRTYDDKANKEVA